METKKTYLIDISTSLEETKADLISVFPNPTKGLLTVKAEAGSQLTLNNIVGQTIMRGEMISDTYSIDLTSLKNGVFILQIESQGRKITKKIVLDK